MLQLKYVYVRVSGVTDGTASRALAKHWGCGTGSGPHRFTIIIWSLGQVLMTASNASRVSVVVGASRGIGLELAKVLLRGGSGDVFATCRKKSDMLSGIAARNSAFHVVSGASRLQL